MKISGRIFAIILVAVLSIFSLSACGSEAEPESAENETSGVATDFYRLSDENRVLTIELSTDPSSGYYWTYEISDEEVLNLTTFGFNPGGEEKNDAVWTSTFASPSNKAGNVSLKLYSVQSQEDVAETEASYDMNIDVAVDGKITIRSITQ